ncbi:MAG TPA: hypothetical protein DCW29_15650 [Janthinobacterium sp.]|nr:hypothetical protein [Janthinobacterium sp.]
MPVLPCRLRITDFFLTRFSVPLHLRPLIPDRAALRMLSEILTFMAWAARREIFKPLICLIF